MSITTFAMTEGHFGDIKENENFRRFNYHSTEKVYKEFMLYAVGLNINKYHRFLYHKIEKFEGKTEQKIALTDNPLFGTIYFPIAPFYVWE